MASISAARDELVGLGRARRHQAGAGGGVQPQRACLRVQGELGRAGPRGRSRLVPTAAAGSFGGVVQRRDDLLVGFVDGGGQVPRAAVLIRGAGECVGERAVCLTSSGAGGGAVDRGADQRVTQRQRCRR